MTQLNFGDLPIEIKWRVPHDLEMPLAVPPVLREGYWYGAYKQGFIAVDIAQQAPAFIFKSDGKVVNFGLLAGGPVLFCEQAEGQRVVVALDWQGDEIWRLKTQVRFTQYSVSTHGGKVLMNGYQGEDGPTANVVLDGTTGREIYTNQEYGTQNELFENGILIVSTDPAWPGLFFNEFDGTTEQIFSRPVILRDKCGADLLIAETSAEGVPENLISYDLAKKAENWQLRIAAISAKFDGRERIYAQEFDESIDGSSHLLCVDRRSGEILWRTALNLEFGTLQLLTIGDRILAKDNLSGLKMFDANTGNLNGGTSPSWVMGLNVPVSENIAFFADVQGIVACCWKDA